MKGANFSNAKDNNENSTDVYKTKRETRLAGKEVGKRTSAKAMPTRIVN